MDSPKKRRRNVLIDEVFHEPDKIQPILVNFQNGHLKESEVKKLKCGIFNEEKSKQLLLGISNDRMVYRGFKPYNELMQTMIGIYNKKRGTVKLISCERWDVTPVLDKEPERTTDFDEDAIAAVNKEFGSKKMKRRTEQFEKMKINVDSVKEQLESTVAGIEIEKLDLTTTVTDDLMSSNNLPRCNREASTVFDVYNVFDILPKNIMKMLYDYVDDVTKNGFPDEKTSFFSSLLDIVEKGPKTHKKTAILIYTRALCKWLEAPVKDARKIEFLTEKYYLPNQVASHLINMYTIASQNGRQRPPLIRYKAIIHIIILILIINNYAINFEEFAKALNIRIGVKKLIEFAKIIGLTSLKDKCNYVLKLPLPSPSPLVLTKKTKRR